MSGIATAVGGLVITAAGAINSGIQQKKALQTQANAQAFESMSQLELQRAVNKATDQQAKMKIIADSQANIIASKEAAKIQAKELSKSAEQRNMVIMSVGGGIVIVGALIMLKK